MRLRVSDFDYELPRSAIAQRPVEPRDASRLLVLDRAASGPGHPSLIHAAFRDLPRWLTTGDLLVVNDSRVIPARLRGRRCGGGAAEILLLRPAGERRWEALVRPSRRLAVGSVVELASGDAVSIGETLSPGTRAVTFGSDPMAALAAVGETPVPPYIHDRSTPAERYQTVYAEPAGSAAAPTAGLHFTTDLLASLAEAGIGQARLTLHVGLDTFRPMAVRWVDQHQIHGEWYQVPAPAVAALASTRAAAGRVVAVGTTSVRVLETVARQGPPSGWTSAFIYPPYAFAAVDRLITNFHLPRSSLLVLVTAFVQAGMPGTGVLGARDTLLAAYRTALAEGYRFFSFGDAMLIL